MNKRIILGFLLGFAPVVWTASNASDAAPEAIQNVFARKRTSLNGKWRIIIDPYDCGYYNYRRVPNDLTQPQRNGFPLDQKPQKPADLVEYGFDGGPALLVPRDWNTQMEKLFYYEGSIWYRRVFDYPHPAPDKRVFVYFGAVNYQADVYLNGQKLGTHIGGFTPFNFEVTGKLKPAGNALIVRVNNARKSEGIPTDCTDWWNYGGITRDVFLVETPATFVSGYSVQLSPAQLGQIDIAVQIDGEPAPQAVISIPDISFEARLTPDTDGIAKGTFAIPANARFQPWSPEAPKLYDVSITCGDDRITERIGFRTIETRGAEILLNGKPQFLRGISIHEENPIRGGRAWSEEDARMLLGWARDLGCNYVRLAHYPHNEYMARIADEMGLMVWAEIPVYWVIQWENPHTLANARNQLAELIRRDRNRASVIIWSVANETPISEARTRFLATLISDARALDGTRLISAALEPHQDNNDANIQILDDPLGALTDIVAFNRYIGWYGSTPEKCDEIRFDIRHNKPVIVSEFGAGALEGLHGPPDLRFSEEYQEELYRRTLPMLERISNLRGMTPWVLADFRSPRRLLPGIQDNWNRKGLIGESGAKKKAWFVLREYYESKGAK